ncbi:MAG: hypothetical protein JW741_15060 [Sedimentisphaerales bacterium]|nr:hypothetical protein [Sedimentisphaerales bacterium]
MKKRGGHSLSEIVVVVLIIGVMACVAVPRLQWGAVDGTSADGVARKLATDLRRARAAALLEAAQNPTGFAVVMTGPPGRYAGYQIVNLQDSAVVDRHEIPDPVRCTGGGRFEFGPLGNLADGSDTTIRISGGGTVCTITIVSATGAVKCAESD